MNRTCELHGDQGDEYIRFETNNPSKGTNPRFYCLICYEDMIAANCCELEEDEGAFFKKLNSTEVPEGMMWVYGEDECHPIITDKQDPTFFGICDPTRGFSIGDESLEFTTNKFYIDEVAEKEEPVDYMKAIRDACK